VLLFPGDAQVGNWSSWAKLNWPAPDGRPGAQSITVADLLSRTVLYKVGHHGSHNATLRAQGLELMTSGDLVAMVPVDHEMAARKHWDKIPFEPLMLRLREKTRGRVLRADDPTLSRPATISDADWAELSARLQWGPEGSEGLWVEYWIP